MSKVVYCTDYMAKNIQVEIVTSTSTPGSKLMLVYNEAYQMQINIHIEDITHDLLDYLT